MVKHIQNNCLSCLSVFDHFVRLALKGLMSLSRQARVGNFGFNVATPSFLLSRSLLLQSKSHQIIITTFFPRFLWTSFFLFPSISSSTRTSLETFINQFYLTHCPNHMPLHPTHPQLICISELPSFTIVHKNWSDTDWYVLPHCCIDKLCLATKTAPSSLNV